MSVVGNKPHSRFLKTIVFGNTHYVVEIVVAKIRILFEGNLRTWMEVFNPIEGEIEKFHVTGTATEKKPAVVILLQQVRKQDKLGSLPGVKRAVTDIDRSPRGYQVVKRIKILYTFQIRIMLERYNPPAVGSGSNLLG